MRPQSAAPYAWTRVLLARSSNAHIGRAGEAACARWLRARGFRVLGERVATPHGELDLVAERGGELWCFEVKTSLARAAPSHFAPGARLSTRQRARVARAARACASDRGGSPPRLALVEVWIDPDGTSRDVRVHEWGSR
ncbi:MAG: YraN family protein [Planctomycetes bacterium]|nr:YraN family protein [Planctomycetota bacterium]